MATWLNDFVAGLAGAVVDAQTQVKKAHISELYGYFENGSPKMVNLQIPRVNPSTGLQESYPVQVPLISLVTPSLLSIKDMQVVMLLDMTDIADADTAARIAVAQAKGLVSAPLGSTIAASEGSSIPAPTTTPPTRPPAAATTSIHSIPESAEKSMLLPKWQLTQFKPAIAASTTIAKQPGQIGTAQVTLTISVEETSESLSKLLGHYNKCL